MFLQMHFDDAYGAYFDFGNHTEKVCCLPACVSVSLVDYGDYNCRTCIR